MAEPEGEMVFGSLQEELEYWKEKALEWRRRLVDVVVELWRALVDQHWPSCT